NPQAPEVSRQPITSRHRTELETESAHASLTRATRPQPKCPERRRQPISSRHRTEPRNRKRARLTHACHWAHNQKERARLLDRACDASGKLCLRRTSDGASRPRELPDDFVFGGQRARLTRAERPTQRRCVSGV